MAPPEEGKKVAAYLGIARVAKKRAEREIGGDAAYIGREIDSEALRSFFAQAEGTAFGYCLGIKVLTVDSIGAETQLASWLIRPLTSTAC